jgi:immune inhibitor A
VIACFYLVTCALGGLLWQATQPTRAELSAKSYPAEPASVPTSVRRQPLPPEQQTARAIAQASLPDRDLLDLAQRLQGLSLPSEQQASDTPSGYEIGEKQTFWLHNVNSSDFFTATARLEYETSHAYWWIEEGYEVGQRALERSALNFETRTYPTNRRVFGSEWTPGIDADPHIYIFLGNVPGVGGYFSSPDEYPTLVRPYSNQHEMFYINLENAQPGNAYFDGILAHEFQHMILWAIDRDEDTWVSEGLSELASHINGYDVGGSDALFADQPDTQLTTWPELEDSGPHYGASYLFLAYFLEHYGEQAVSDLVAEPADGINGFNVVLAHTPPLHRRFEDLLADWVIANYLDDPELGSGRYGYSDLQLDPPQHANHHTDFPVEEEAAVRQYAADYILIEADSPLELQFTGNPVVPLVGNEPHSGDYQWWSVRGDEGDARLTRAFDLSELQRATLRAWMWYDLEADYDYAYVQVSPDGGQTWNILANEHTTSSNPNGNSYGPAFTGHSGERSSPQWVLEQFDLTPYAGQKILVRFEVVTDDTVTGPGLCLDDISIPELRYSTDVEDGPDGWQAEGWIRVTSHVPQDFIVQMISFGNATSVQTLPLDERMQGTFTIPGLGQDVKRVVLVISALAPATTEQAGYSYQLREQ